MKEEFEILRDKLILIREDKYEKRPFLYLDIIAWLDAKIQDEPISLVIRESKN